MSSDSRFGVLATVGVLLMGGCPGDGDPAEPVCGNGQVESGEACDGSDLGGLTCESEGYPGGGQLVCTSACLLDYSGCAMGCGDGVLAADEACDGSALGGLTCETEGYLGGGQLACTSGCLLDPSGCLTVCGNGQVEPGEVCDDGGTAPGDGCGPTCLTEICGNGYPDPGEECDDGNLASHDACSSVCTVEAETWKRRTNVFPRPRAQHAVAYDVARGRILLFGGRVWDDGSVWPYTDTWQWDGNTWLPRYPSPAAPSARVNHAMIYDPVRQTVLLFGGFDTTYLDDTWEWSGDEWTLLSPTARPSARSRHALTFDAAHGRVVLFGGEDAAGPTDDTWEWDGTTWTQAPVASPPPARADHALAYDARVGVVFLFGGEGVAGLLGDIWRWDGATWSVLSPSTSPAARKEHSLVYDAGRGRAMLFGGALANGAGADTWDFDGVAWTAHQPSAAPTAREGYAATYDARQGQVVIVGGAPTASATEMMGDTWAWDGAGWVLLTPPTPFSSGYLFRGSMAYDMARSRVVTYGTPTKRFYDGQFTTIESLDPQTWEWDGTRWLLRPHAGQPPRGSLVYDGGRQRVMLFGGMRGNYPNYNTVDETWVWDGTDWTQLMPQQSPPARAGHCMAYDDVRDRVVLFGGMGQQGSPAYDNNLGDIWEWDGLTWTEQVPASTPVPRPRHACAMAYHPGLGEVILVGGLASFDEWYETLHDQWGWDGTAWIGHGTSQTGLREESQMSYHVDRGTLIMFGGRFGWDGFWWGSSDTWEWGGSSWTLVDVLARPEPRSGIAMAYDHARAQIVIIGGSVDWESGTWPPIEGPPTYRAGDTWTFPHYDSALPDEACYLPGDADGDGVAGCDDPDCAAYCGQCGDGTCGAGETCRLCPADCGGCPVACGDFACDPTETAANCPGDCSG